MSVRNLPRREPVVTAGLIVSAIGTVINVLNAFAITTIAPAQVEAINACIIAMWPLLLVIRQAVWSPASVEQAKADAYQDAVNDYR